MKFHISLLKILLYTSGHIFFTLLATSLSCYFAKALRPLFCVLEYDISKPFYTLHFFHHLVCSVALFVLAYNKKIASLVVVFFFTSLLFSLSKRSQNYFPLHFRLLRLHKFLCLLGGCTIF